jgi:elongation factor P
MPLTDQFVKGMYIVDEGRIYSVIDRKYKTQGRQGGLIILRLKAVDSGQQIEKTIKAGVKLEYIEPETKSVQYLYSDDTSSHFMDNDTYETLSVSKELVGEYINFLKEGDACIAVLFDGKIVNIKGDITVELKVTEASPAVRGNTANSATKTVTLETGYKVNVPLFIQTGDVVKVNTDTGTYSGKAN